MEDVSCGAGGGGMSSSSAARVKPSYLSLGDRQIFTVELRPGETTFVSWKKLVKDANKVNSTRTGNETANVGGFGLATTLSSGNLQPPSSAAHPALESRIAPGQPGESERPEAPQTNRFSAVIEKIERLYMGKDSSDEEDLKDVPDDDQYDTEDSFIDDAELDEYFEVDNSAIKHDGFFVNRGKLERIEPPVLPNEQPTKRRRKYIEKPDTDAEKRLLNKHAKPGKPLGLKAALGTGSSRMLVVTGEHRNEVKPQQASPSTGYLKRNKAETKQQMHAAHVKAANGSNTIPLTDDLELDKTRSLSNPAKSSTNRPKDVSGPSTSMHQNYQDKGIYTSSKIQSIKPNIGEVDASLRSKEKNGIRELPDLNSYPDIRSLTSGKVAKSQKRDSVSSRPKSSMLERSIRELEKMVAESRPPNLGNPEADTTAQSIKRRLPPEIKLKLAKVARLAGREGRISKELINRLMSILGHLIQVRTLKRNLRDMISMGMRAKEEKDDMFQQLKKEVVDMIKTHAHSLEAKACEQQPASNDFQQHETEAKGSSRPKCAMDSVLEDKICDLYDLFLDGLDEDAGPQVRKLYAELAGLWPNGYMDNHGIKLAICRAKDRRRGMSSRWKEDDKLHRKKPIPRAEEATRVDPNPQTAQDNASSTAASSDRQKQEPAKKKLKRKPEHDADDRSEKSHKSPKQTSVPSHRSNLNSPAPPPNDAVAETIKS